MFIGGDMAALKCFNLSRLARMLSIAGRGEKFSLVEMASSCSSWQ